MKKSVNSYKTCPKKNDRYDSTNDNIKGYKKFNDLFPSLIKGKLSNENKFKDKISEYSNESIVKCRSIPHIKLGKSDKLIFQKKIFSSLPRVCPLKIKSHFLDKVIKEGPFNLSQSKINFKLTNLSKFKFIQNEVKDEIKRFNNTCSGNFVKDIINFYKEKHEYNNLEKSIHNVKTSKNKKINNPILTVNPWINYQQIIEDTNVLYMFHNENLSKLKKGYKIFDS